ncbi:MAG: methylated-DNA--[protein]-cysteine S-methyltransferase [Succinatimonas hippei]|nr:methylated-DNA--[protein]-cysteine S-methyltransferase [Succinatimonas hippei]
MATAFAIYNFRFGFLKIGYDGDTVLSIDKVEDNSDSGIKTAFSDHVFSEIDEYLRGKRKSFDFKYRLEGTQFQLKIWNALERIPYGETRSYKEIAEEIGCPKACRAVGMANHANPVMIAVPCHRVIGANGSLTGYGGGIEMKKALLKLEKSNR